MNKTAQEGAGCQDHGRRLQPSAVFHDDASNTAIDHIEIECVALDNVQAWRRFDCSEHRQPVKLSICLGPWTPHGRTLFAVQHSELDAGNIGNAAHQAIHRVDLTNQMSFAEPADRRIAGHDPDRVSSVGNERSYRTEARSRTGRLSPCMAAADDDHIIATIGHIKTPKQQGFS
ncbi:hypothetical protein GGD53_001186 [Rhizobium aethiopicum]|uniref:Uncharacterized protein n=1 Tax=Rhizobium aethiopicum TaxID=1138170 RepID=A0A7W6Q8X1_9HYPH|nr:hypothetical protein [Rhizobium aethiopicum]